MARWYQFNESTRGLTFVYLSDTLEKRQTFRSKHFVENSSKIATHQKKNCLFLSKQCRGKLTWISELRSVCRCISQSLKYSTMSVVSWSVLEECSVSLHTLSKYIRCITMSSGEIIRPNSRSSHILSWQVLQLLFLKQVYLQRMEWSSILSILVAVYHFPNLQHVNNVWLKEQDDRAISLQNEIFQLQTWTCWVILYTDCHAMRAI